MSLLGDIFGGLLAVGGVATANPGLIAAGGSMLAGSLAGDASQNAAGQQVAANQQALALNQQRYQQGTAALAPYQYGGPAQAALSPPVTNQGGGPLLARYTQPAIAAGNLLGYGGQPNARNMALGQPNPLQGGGMVTLRAPTGEMKQVPAAQAQQFIARGATVVSQ